jgi:hypothetical protein
VTEQESSGALSSARVEALNVTEAAAEAVVAVPTEAQLDLVAKVVQELDTWGTAAGG